MPPGLIGLYSTMYTMRKTLSYILFVYLFSLEALERGLVRAEAGGVIPGQLTESLRPHLAVLLSEARNRTHPERPGKCFRHKFYSPYELPY
jgi:hypothetical protein